MTPEDLAQITAIVTAAEQRTASVIATAIAAAEQRTTAAIATAIAAAEQRTTAAIAGAEQRATERLERAVEALTANLSEVRQELSIRLDTLNHRFEAQAPIILTMDQRVSALVRQGDRLERDNGAMLANDAAKQRAFDALAARVSKIERALHLEQQ